MKLKIFLLGLALFLGSCKNQNGVEDTMLIDVKAAIDEQLDVKGIVSGTSFSDGHKIAVCVVPWKDSETPGAQGVLSASGNYRDNLGYVYGSGSFVAPANATYPNAFVKVDLYAAYPFGGSYTIGNGVYQTTVEMDQSTDANFEKSDFMNAYTEGVLPGTNPAKVDLTFKHRLSKITVLIAKPTTYKGENITSVNSVVVKNVMTQSSVGLKDDTFTSSVSGNVTMNKRDESPAQVEFAAICAPNSVVAGYEVDVVLQGATNQYTFTYQGNLKLEAGKNHTVSITTFEDERLVQLGNGVINGWNDAGTITGGDIVEQGANEKFAMTAVTQTVNKVKLTCSDGYVYELVAAKDASNKLTFKFTGEFAKSPEKYPYTVSKVEFFNGATLSGGGVLTTPLTVSTRTSNELTIVNSFR